MPKRSRQMTAAPDFPGRQPRFSFLKLTCQDFRKKAPTPWAPQPARNRADSSSDCIDFSGAGRSTVTITGLTCQLGPNFWAVKKCNCHRHLYTTFGVETLYRSTGKAGRETFQRRPEVDAHRAPQGGAVITPLHPARCQTSCSCGFHREPFASKLACTVVRQQLATGSVKGLCTTSTPSCRQTARPGMSPEGLYTIFGIHARRLTRPVFPPFRPTPATLPGATLRSESQKNRIPCLRRPRLALVARQNVYALFDVAAVTTLIKYPNRGTLE